MKAGLKINFRKSTYRDTATLAHKRAHTTCFSACINNNQLFFFCCCCVLHSIERIECIWATISNATDHFATTKNSYEKPFEISNIHFQFGCRQQIDKYSVFFFFCYSVKSKWIRFIKLKFFGVFLPQPSACNKIKLICFQANSNPYSIWKFYAKFRVGVLQRVNNERMFARDVNFLFRLANDRKNTPPNGSIWAYTYFQHRNKRSFLSLNKADGNIAPMLRSST